MPHAHSCSHPGELEGAPPPTGSPEPLGPWAEPFHTERPRPASQGKGSPAARARPPLVPAASGGVVEERGLQSATSGPPRQESGSQGFGIVPRSKILLTVQPTSGGRPECSVWHGSRAKAPARPGLRGPACSSGFLCPCPQALPSQATEGSSSEKPSLEPPVLSSPCLVSNPPFLAQVMERAGAEHLQVGLNDASLQVPSSLPSGWPLGQRLHWPLSPRTASGGGGRSVLLQLLHPSATFDLLTTLLTHQLIEGGAQGESVQGPSRGNSPPDAWSCVPSRPFS